MIKYDENILRRTLGDRRNIHSFTKEEKLNLLKYNVLNAYHNKQSPDQKNYNKKDWDLLETVIDVILKDDNVFVATMPNFLIFETEMVDGGLKINSRALAVNNYVHKTKNYNNVLKILQIGSQWRRVVLTERVRENKLKLDFPSSIYIYNISPILKYHIIPDSYIKCIRFRAVSYYTKNNILKYDLEPPIPQNNALINPQF